MPLVGLCTWRRYTVVVELKLNEAQLEELRARAKSLGIAPEDLARAAIADLLANPQDEFEAAARQVLSRHEELYKRLA